MTLQSQRAGIREVDDLGPWFHNLHLPDGTETAPDHPLGDFPAFKWAELAPLGVLEPGEHLDHVLGLVRDHDLGAGLEEVV